MVEDVRALDVAGDLFESPREDSVDRHMPRAAPLALVDGDDAAAQVDVGPLEPEDFVAAHPRVDGRDDEGFHVEHARAQA